MTLFPLPSFDPVTSCPRITRLTILYFAPRILFIILRTLTNFMDFLYEITLHQHSNAFLSVSSTNTMSQSPTVTCQQTTVCAP